MSNRNMHSTHSIELAEVGMEEALWALNNNVLSLNNQVDPAAWVATGWVLTGSTQSKTITGFGYENGAAGQVDITVESYATTPRITVVGKTTLGDHSTITRTLQSDTQRSPLFTNAIGAVGNLTFNFAGTVDSYTASDALNPATYAYGFSAVVSGANVDLGNSSVYGYATTKGTTLQNLSGAKLAGSLAATGIDAARLSTNGSQPLFDSIEPSIGGGSGPITSSTTFATAGAYRLDSIDLPDGEVITISAPVMLKVSNSVRTSGSGSIVITNTGSLELQIDENDGFGLVLDGAGIVNQSRLPRNLSVLIGGNYLGNPISSINVTNDFYGSIYLPRDDLTIASNSPIFGALIAKSVTFTASAPQFHYDPGLQNFSVAEIKAPIALVQLRELSPTGL